MFTLFHCNDSHTLQWLTLKAYVYLTWVFCNSGFLFLFPHGIFKCALLSEKKPYPLAVLSLCFLTWLRYLHNEWGKLSQNQHGFFCSIWAFLNPLTDFSVELTHILMRVFWCLSPCCCKSDIWYPSYCCCDGYYDKWMRKATNPHKQLTLDASEFGIFVSKEISGYQQIIITLRITDELTNCSSSTSVTTHYTLHITLYDCFFSSV